MLMQMALFHSFLWLSSISLYVYTTSSVFLMVVYISLLCKLLEWKT